MGWWRLLLPNRQLVGGLQLCLSLPLPLGLTRPLAMLLLSMGGVSKLQPLLPELHLLPLPYVG